MVASQQTLSPQHKPIQPIQPITELMPTGFSSSLPPLPSPIAPAVPAEARVLEFDYRVAPFGVQFLGGDCCAFKVGANEQVTVRATQTLTSAMGPVEWSIHIDNHAAKTHGQSIIVGIVPHSFTAFKGPLFHGGWGYESCGRWCGEVEEEDEQEATWISLRAMNSLTFTTGSTVCLRFDPSTAEMTISAVCNGVMRSTTRRLRLSASKFGKGFCDVVPAVTLTGVTDRVTCMGVRYDHVTITQHTSEVSRVRAEAQRLVEIMKRQHFEELQALKTELALARAGAILKAAESDDALAPQEQLVAAIGQLKAPAPVSASGALLESRTYGQIEHHNTQAAVAHAEALELVDQLTRTLKRRNEALNNAQKMLTNQNTNKCVFEENSCTYPQYSAMSALTAVAAYPPLPSPAATEDWLSPTAVRSPSQAMTGLPTPRASSTCGSAATSPLGSRFVSETIHM